MAESVDERLTSRSELDIFRTESRPGATRRAESESRLASRIKAK